MTCGLLSNTKQQHRTQYIHTVAYIVAIQYGTALMPRESCINTILIKLFSGYDSSKYATHFNMFMFISKMILLLNDILVCLEHVNTQFDI